MIHVLNLYCGITEQEFKKDFKIKKVKLSETDYKSID